MKWSAHISEFENLLPNTGLQVEKALQLYENLMPKKRGKVVFLAGERGSGRSEALKALAETFSKEHKNLQVISGKFRDGKYLAISAKGGGFSQKAEAVGNILAFLAKVVALKTGLPIDLILESASFLFDFIGQLLQTSASVKNAVDELNENPPNIAELPNAIKRLLRSAVQDSPIICLFDDFDEARYEWHEFLDNFAEEIGKDLPILFFVSLRGRAELGEHQEGETNLEMVTRRTVSRGLAEWWHLRPMTQEEIVKWIDAKTEIGMISKLHGVTGGIPRWVKELWRDWKTGGFINFNESHRGWEWSKDKEPTLNPFNDVLKDLIALLLKTDNLVEITKAREILSIAALEGTTFTTQVLALATNQDTDDVMDFLDDYFVQSGENPSGILREEGFLTLEIQPEITLNVFRYSFISDWHWKVLNRYALTDDEKKQKSTELITALQVAYEGDESLTAKSLAQLYRNIDDTKQANHFRTIASYSQRREVMYQQAQLLMTLKTDNWDQFQFYQHAKFLLEAGETTKLAYPTDETIRIFEYAADLAHKAQATEILAWAISRSGDAYLLNGENEIAKKKAEMSLRLFEKTNIKDGKASSLYLLAKIAQSEGDYEEAKSKANESLQIYEKIALRLGQALALNLLAENAYWECDYEEAKSKANKSLLIWGNFVDRQSKAISLNILAKTAYAEGNYKEGKWKANESLPIYEEIGDRQGKAMTLGLLANIALAEGDYEEAKSKAIESLQMAREIDHVGKAGSLNSLAKAAHKQGKIEQAISLASLSCQLLIGSGYFKYVQATFNDLLNESSYSEEQAHALTEKAKAEYAKDKGKSWIEELLQDL
jgi:hypothetical protein